MSRIAADGSKRTRVKCIVLGAAGAGKTSILRRYFNDTFSSHRVPTQGSDFYTGRVKTPQHHVEDEKKADDYTDVSLQVWDTAGRERFVAGRKTKYTAALSDEFFRHANACMLVYDATSSTSFTQLLKWHADLMRRMKELQIERMPILIVANKMDILKREFEPQQRRTTVPQRKVMGLPENFTGKDMPYEYRASPPSNTKEESTDNGRRVEISTYMTTGDTWTNDQVYITSVLNTEDISHPDRDMVLLWCMRNGLKHMEVSALDGA